MAAPPLILGILCNWCAYRAADAAGASREPSPAGVRLMRVMCSGRVEPSLVLEAFASGVDGVVLGACRPGDCHYLHGNCMAAFRVRMLHGMLDQLQIEQQRLELVWISASEGALFAASLREMSTRLQSLGPIRAKSLGPITGLALGSSGVVS